MPDEVEHPAVNGERALVANAILNQGELVVSPANVATKRQRELIQLSSYIDLPSELWSFEQIENDPPDFLVEVDGESFRVELTQLAVQTIRPTLAALKKVLPEIEKELNRSAAHSHLRGRVVDVLVSYDPPQVSGTSFSAAILRSLEDDRGVVHWEPDPLDPSNDWGVLVGGMYSIDGMEDSASITVRESDQAGYIHVTGAMSVVMRESELRSTLAALVKKKDRAENQVLLISIDAPDETGRLTGSDGWLYHQLIELDDPLGGIAIAYLNEIVIHQWGSPERRTLFVRPDARSFGNSVAAVKAAHPGVVGDPFRDVHKRFGLNL